MVDPIAVLRNIPYAPPIPNLPIMSRRILDLYIPTRGVSDRVRHQLRTQPPTSVVQWSSIEGAPVTEPLCFPHIAHRHRAIIVWVHGGSWLVGTHDQPNAREVCKCFARMGYMVASVNYRRCTPDYRLLELVLFGLGLIALCAFLRAQSTIERVVWLLMMLLFAIHLLLFEVAYAQWSIQHPVPSRDVASAIAWVHTHALKFGGDPTRIVLVGHSAGAHLVMNVVTHAAFLNDVAIPVHHIVGCVGLSGVYSARLAAQWSALRLICCSVFGSDTKAWNRYFPAEDVSNHPHPESLPPILLMTAEFDFGLHAHAIELRRALRKAGVPVRVENVRNTTHFTIVTHWKYQRFPILDRIDRYCQWCCCQVTHALCCGDALSTTNHDNDDVDSVSDTMIS